MDLSKTDVEEEVKADQRSLNYGLSDFELPENLDEEVNYSFERQMNEIDNMTVKRKPPSAHHILSPNKEFNLTSFSSDNVSTPQVEIEDQK